MEQDNLTAEERTRKILKENKYCTLATASLDGKPEAATVKFVEDENYNLYFEILSSSRKCSNIHSNPRASVVITTVPHTVQMDGVVEELPNGDEVKKMMTIKQERESSFYQSPELKFFKFTPNWIRTLVKREYPPKYEVILDKN